MTDNLTSQTDASIWDVAKSALAAAMAAETFESWFAPIKCVGADGGVLTLEAGTEFAADWLRDNYSDLIARHLRLAAGMDVKFEITASENPQPQEEATERAEFRRERQPAAKKEVPPPAINPRNTFENFVVGDGNAFAHATALAVANAPGSAFNPLCIYAPTGLGKTHLMHAVAHFIFKNSPQKRIVYISSERFLNEFIAAAKENDYVSFRKKYRDVDVLMIDDVQFFAGKKGLQREFFHTFNDLFESCKQIIISSDRPVSEIQDLEARLVSRFEWGVSVDIEPPDYETRLAILAKKAAAYSVEIPMDVLDFIAKNITGNVRRMEGALNRLAGFCSLVSSAKRIDVPTAQKLLADFLRQEDNPEQICVEKILEVVAKSYKVSVDDILGARRTQGIALARQVAMFAAKKLTKQSLVEIGKQFGGRTHGTVVHAISSVSDAMELDGDFARYVKSIFRELGAELS
ncbi:MAG: chromosomal replication initiator protein DnaA [Opitutales bacterium]|nr:chromosomal replication initiator protein DnaA [Opitutales bacterium]